jgi:hypothetical protein
MRDGRRHVVERRDLGEQRARVVVARPEALEVQHAHAAELADRDRRLGGHDGVHRRGEHRQLEAVRVDLPGDGDVLRVPGATGGDDGDVVEGVRPAAALASADLDLGGHGDRLVSGCSWGPRP